MNRQDKKNIFKNVAQLPYSWKETADMLKSSADILAAEITSGITELKAKTERKSDLNKSDLNKVSMFPVYMLIAGYSLENLLKGILIALNPSYIQNGSFDNNFPLSNHDYLNLFNGVNDKLDQKDKITLTPEGKKILKELSKYTTWAGRYSVPKKF